MDLQKGESKDEKLIDLSVFFPDPAEIYPAAEAEVYAAYPGDSLFDYIDGGAEVYLAFGFLQVGMRDYLIPLAEETCFTLDVYDMGSENSAFGIFNRERYDDLPEVKVGISGASGGGSLLFWQGPYYVKIRADDEGQAVDKILMKMGTLVSKRIGPPGKAPMELELFPEKDRKKHSERYSAMGLLGFDFLRGFSASFQSETQDFKLHLCRFESESEALVAERSLVDNLKPNLEPAMDGKGFYCIFKKGDRGRFFRAGGYIAIVQGLVDSREKKDRLENIIEDFFTRVIQAAQEAKETQAVLKKSELQDSEEQGMNKE
ncbi:MAG: hypothetical protein KJ645_00440 [Planctomycetes bacterium]|nr:hypothetical protein [Planctomycetota bacterium]